MLDQHFSGAFHAHFNATDGLYFMHLAHNAQLFPT
ncbi:hypothetical protein ANAPH2_01363 [Anaplasma phagocytophilum]|nr:hypothetical protein ANAPH2_01363 [Anaplasma phagocytophilum]